jgi:DNA-binding NtrC family response regulator
MPHVLLVDDDPDTLEWLSELVKAEGFSVATADSLRAARIHLTRLAPDVLLTDLILPDGQGIELVNDLESRGSTEPVMTGYASTEAWTRSAGATDYLVKPVDIDRVKAILKRVPRPEELREAIGELRQELGSSAVRTHIGQSPPSRSCTTKPSGRTTSATVMLVGERHRQGAHRPDDPGERRARRSCRSTAARCRRGSSSSCSATRRAAHRRRPPAQWGFFERAHGGTLFLDEIGDSARSCRSSCPRPETGTFMRVGTNTAIATDVRLIAATNPRAGEGGRGGQLREDRYHRLNVFPLRSTAPRPRHRHRDPRPTLPRSAEPGGGHEQGVFAGRDRFALRAQLAGRRRELKNRQRRTSS